MALPPQRDETQLHTPVGGHQDLLPGSLHKPQDQLHPPGSESDTRSKRATILPSVEGDHKCRKLDKMRQQRNVFQMKNKIKTPSNS